MIDWNLVTQAAMICVKHGHGVHFIARDPRNPTLTVPACVLCLPDHPDNPVRGLSGLNLFPKPAA